MKLLNRVQLFATPWTVAYQAPQPMEFSRQEYWSGLPIPSPGDETEGRIVVTKGWSVFFAVSSTRPSSAGFLPLNSGQPLETKQVGRRLGSPGPSPLPRSLWGWTLTSQQGKAGLQGFHFLALHNVMLFKLSYSSIWRNIVT